MKNIKVAVINNNTLEILEDANIGDRIDLNSIHDIDIDRSSIETLIANISNEEFNKRLEKEIEILNQKKDLEFQNILSEKSNNLKDEINNLKLEKTRLEDTLKSNDDKLLLTVSNEVSKKENELIKVNSEEVNKLKTQILNLNNKLESKDLLLENEKQALVIQYNKEIEEKESILKEKEDQISMLKDFKFKQSTKILGETLEQHIKTVWEQTGKFMFANAIFEKDNKLSEDNTKGDFIFREFDENGEEILSIMFEMKNESDASSSKNKNSNFYLKLDKDRKFKNCEYAVLVSLLEKEVEYFNDIYVVNPKEYEKMYVIRPQHFITLINFLRQGNLLAQEYKTELINFKKREVDVTNFENNLKNFQEGFSRNYDSASKHFAKAIDEIDKSIDHLQKIKKELTTSENQLRLANKKSEDLSIKRLTKDAPSIRKMFEEIK